jgi:ABC-type transport system involved in multi-copper enzyme maturation permease subunit
MTQDLLRPNKMIKFIVKKDFFLNLISFRYSIAFISIFLLFSIGSLFFLKEYSFELKKYREISSGFSMAKSIESTQYFPVPNKLNFCIEGGEKHFPDVYGVNSFGFIDVGSSWKKIYYITSFENLDWAFIIAIYLSLVSLVLSYDAFGLEKEEGTLRLILSNPIKKIEVLYGKFISIFLGILIIFSVSVVSSFIIIILSPNINLSFHDFIKIFYFIILSIIYIIFFILVGLLTSALAYRPSLSLILALIYWFIFVILIPIFIPYVIPKNIPSQIEFELQNKLLEKEAKKQFSQISDHNILVKKISNAKSEQEVNTIIKDYEMDIRNFNIENFRKIDHLKEEYQKKIENYIERTNYISLISPAGLYFQASESLIGAGYSRYKNIYKKLKDYSKIYAQYCERKEQEHINEAKPGAHMTFFIPDKGSPGGKKLVQINISYSFRGVKFDLSDFPIFEEKNPNFIDQLKDSGMALGIMIIYIILFLFLLIKALNNFDPR